MRSCWKKIKYRGFFGEAKLTNCYTMSEGKALMSGTETFEAQVDIALEVKRYGHIKRKSLEAAISAVQ